MPIDCGTNAAPVFSGSESIAYKYSGMRLWIDDWNEDGLPDMLTSDYNGYVWIWIQQSTGVTEGTTPIPSRRLSASSNPFMELVTVTGVGFSAGALQIFDVSGRKVLEREVCTSLFHSGSNKSTTRCINLRLPARKQYPSGEYSVILYRLFR
ncbi:MAG: hypothetical protein KAR44_09060 [Candidatus Aegiribacteria sp.]|nr:hypothetical protein [Candidatus Aegiribacteria sp.]